ncbi:conjugal transfer protein TraF, partial [Escherichia coli]|nr:conjugal transfer protein TraF [Escherichia coli]
VGLVAQNIIPRSIDTKVVNGFKETFKVRPQATAGVSWHNDLFTTALDIDLTPASGFTSDSKRQFASVGAEFNAWKWAQLRAGYRQNMASNSGSAFTAGVGISPFDVVHIDVSGLVGTDHDYGAMAQLQFTF